MITPRMYPSKLLFLWQRLGGRKGSGLEETIRNPTYSLEVSRMDRNYCPDNVTVHAGLKNASLHKVRFLNILNERSYSTASVVENRSQSVFEKYYVL